MITVRGMEIDDIDAVCGIEKESFSVPWDANGFFTYLIHDDTMFIVACEDEKIVGYCGLLMVPDEGDIMNIAVKKDARGRGIGTLLLDEVIKRGAEKGVFKIYLEVRESNEAAKKLYANADFAEIGRRKNYYEKPVEDAVLMMREASKEK